MLPIGPNCSIVKLKVLFLSIYSRKTFDLIKQKSLIIILISGGVDFIRRMLPWASWWVQLRVVIYQFGIPTFSQMFAKVSI